MFIDRSTDPNAPEEAGRPPKGEAEIIVAKHRNGPVDSCRLAYLERFTRFLPLARNP
jgi:replicative DNA helicase